MSKTTFSKGDLVKRISNDKTKQYPPGTLGILLEEVNANAPIWRVLVGERGNVAEWTAYNFERAFEDEQRPRRSRRSRRASA